MDKICVVKCGEIFKYEEEYESTFSNRSTSLAEVLYSNINNKVARLPKILPDPISVILSHCVFQEFQKIERGPKAGGVAYQGELYRHHAYF